MWQQLTKMATLWLSTLEKDVMENFERRPETVEVAREVKLQPRREEVLEQAAERPNLIVENETIYVRSHITAKMWDEIARGINSLGLAR